MAGNPGDGPDAGYVRLMDDREDASRPEPVIYDREALIRALNEWWPLGRHPERFADLYEASVREAAGHPAPGPSHGKDYGAEEATMALAEAIFRASTGDPDGDRNALAWAGVKPRVGYRESLIRQELQKLGFDVVEVRGGDA